MKEEKYRIVEHHYKFYVEKLVRFLFWKTYIPITDESLSIEQQLHMTSIGKSTSKLFNTFDEAKEYIEGCEIKYHKI